MFFKIGVLKNFAKFTGKHLCQSLFFNKVAGLRLAILLKKRHWHRWFPLNFAKNFKNTFFLRTPPMPASVELYRIWMNSKAFLIDFYYWFQNSCFAEQFPFTVILSSYLFWKSYFFEQLFFRTAIFHNNYLQEQPPNVFYIKS